MAQIGVEVLSVLEGHDDKTLVIDDSDLKKRKELSKEVERLLRKGFTVMVGGENGQPARKVKGYDPEKNEWIVASAKKRKQDERVVADSSGKATAIAPIAGG